MYSAVRIVTPRLNPVVALSVLKRHLRVDNTSDDSLIATYLDAATSWAESILDRTLTTTVLQWVLAESRNVVNNPFFNNSYSGLGYGYSNYNAVFVNRRALELPRSPAQSVASVIALENDGTHTTLDVSTYTLDTGTEPARLTVDHPQYGAGLHNLAVTYTTGYGDLGTSVPQAIVQAIMLKVGHMYEHRGDDDAVESRTAMDLLEPFRLISFGR